MANDNQVSIVGNATGDPELRYTPAGAAVAKFRVAVNRRTKDSSGEWKDGETSYFSVNAWRDLAENVAESIQRGSRVIVQGRLQQRSWETDEGSKRTVIEIEADEVGPSLRFAKATVEKKALKPSEPTASDVEAMFRKAPTGSVQPPEPDAPVQSASPPAKQEPPSCDQCGSAMRWKEGGTSKAGKPYNGFWGCPNFKDENHS